MSESVTQHINSSLLRVIDLLGQWLDQHLINILAILFGAWVVRHFGMRFVESILRHTVRPDLYPTKVDREKRLKTLNSLAGAFVRTGIYIIAAMLIVGEINPHYTTALFASAGVIGIALGFGAKDVIHDFMSGIFIITENQYRVGDVVEIGGVSGVVEDITIRTTVLRDLSGNVHHVPNGSIDITTNMTLNYAGINVDISVGYDTDIARLQHVIDHVGEEMAAAPNFKDKVLEAPAFLRVDEFGDHGITVKIVGKTVSGEQWLIKGELLRRLKVAFEKNHIDIPYPQIVVHKPK
ncbi:hypothetical protein BH23PAT1_BH23PAT1_3260 [soil metagenome]